MCVDTCVDTFRVFRTGSQPIPKAHFPRSAVTVSLPREAKPPENRPPSLPLPKLCHSVTRGALGKASSWVPFSRLISPLKDRQPVSHRQLRGAQIWAYTGRMVSESAIPCAAWCQNRVSRPLAVPSSSGGGAKVRQKRCQKYCKGASLETPGGHKPRIVEGVGQRDSLVGGGVACALTSFAQAAERTRNDCALSLRLASCACDLI